MIAEERGFMRSIVVGFLALFGLAGCYVSEPRNHEAEAKAQAAYANCEELRSLGQLKTHRAAVQCAARPVVEAYQAAAYPFMDLVFFSLEARQLGAERVDAGDVSDEQYQRDVAALDARIAAEEARRRNAMTLGGNPKPTPQAALVQGLPSFAEEARAAAPRPTPNGCVPLAGIRSCQ